jgi:hypothetical protein
MGLTVGAEENQDRYESLRHFITSSGSPARGGRHLLSFEQAMNDMTPPEDENEAGFRLYATHQYQAVVSPSPLATEEQPDYCHRTRQEMEKWRAMYDAGWKTPAEEGYDALDLKVRPVDWDGKANPYPAGTVEHDEWADGYDNAIQSAGDELADAYEALREQLAGEEERLANESTLDWFLAHAEQLAHSADSTFMTLSAIDGQMWMLSATLFMLESEVKQYLPSDLHERLLALVNLLAHGGHDREIERIRSIEDRLVDLRQPVTDVRLLGAEIAARDVLPHCGAIDGDL